MSRSRWPADLGVEAASFTGSQADHHRHRPHPGQILEVRADRLARRSTTASAGVAGFQGVSTERDITTSDEGLGRDRGGPRRGLGPTL